MTTVPTASDPVWEKLASGKISHKFELFAANMMIARACRTVAADPSTKPAMIRELHGFFDKYAAVVANDLEKLR